MDFHKFKHNYVILALLIPALIACEGANFRGANGEKASSQNLHQSSNATAQKDNKNSDGTDSKSKKNDTDSGSSHELDPTDGSTSEGGNPSDGGNNEGDDIDIDEGQLITDIFELEECKAEIFERTGDLSLCMKCFTEFMAAGGVISKVKCGCETKEVSRTMEHL